MKENDSDVETKNQESTPSPITEKDDAPLHEGNPTDEDEKQQPASDESDDEFDLGRLRLSQDFAESIKVKKVHLSVPVRKPKKQEFVRVRPGEDWRLQTGILILKDQRDEIFLVDPLLWGPLSTEITPAILFTCVNRQNVPFLWPVKLPGPDGRHNIWHSSALEAAARAEAEWIRLVAADGSYEAYVSEADLPEPEWPELSFKELITIAFKDNYIKDMNHPVIRMLRGLA